MKRLHATTPAHQREYPASPATTVLPEPAPSSGLQLDVKALMRVPSPPIAMVAPKGMSMPGVGENKQVLNTRAKPIVQIIE